ncbi:hypothetical protein V7149_05120 [Bacillus sp. JJ1503]|uniref:hypothetical protein n=1 Tax=Bacillus sp. JJ1503 TaxID=3122956 RepID=UPI002FFF87CE
MIQVIYLTIEGIFTILVKAVANLFLFLLFFGSVLQKITNGCSPLADLMFVLYFGVISAIKPSVMVAAFAGASLTYSNPIQTGITSFRFGVAGFIVPFIIF